MLRAALVPRIRPLLRGSVFTHSSRSYVHAPSKPIKCNEFGVPEEPTWSVNELLSSYPRPQLEKSTVDRLYKLSALVPPPSESAEYQEMKEGLEEMVRLVEAVKQVDTTGVEVLGRGEEEDADRLHLEKFGHSEGEKSGKDLLAYASRTANGFYVIDTDKRR